MCDPVIEALRGVAPVTRGEADLGGRAKLAAERSARHVVVPGSGHAVHQHSPTLVAGAVLDLISWRK